LKTGLKAEVLAVCRRVLPEWQPLNDDDFDVEPPKGFSTITMTIRTQRAVEPAGIFYRQLEGKDNAILDSQDQEAMLLTLEEQEIAAKCYYRDDRCRLEALYDGRTLIPADLTDPNVLRGIARELHHFHSLRPAVLPPEPFFELLHRKWGPQARFVVEDSRSAFPENEQRMCDELRALYSDETRRMVQRCMPEAELRFCHNDTYHGNIMALTGGAIRLLDFEFSCLNNPAFDFSNLFAETVMEHKQPEYPYFRIAEQRFGADEMGTLINFYLDHREFADGGDRARVFDKLLADTQAMLMLSDYMYAMAALPLALAPVQNIPFIAYAHARFLKFRRSYEARQRTLDAAGG
jgi:thiamine kinase-like enzyme